MRLVHSGELETKPIPGSPKDYLVSRVSLRRLIGSALRDRSECVKPRRSTRTRRAGQYDRAPTSSLRLPPGIVATPGVCGGDPRVDGTRIPIWALEQSRRLGSSAEQLVAEYPALTLADVFRAWAFAAEHRELMDNQIHQNEVA